MHDDYTPLDNGDQNGNRKQPNGDLRWIPEHAGLVLAIVILISACVPIIYLWNHSSRALDEEVQAALLETAQSAALLIRGDLHESFTDKSQEQEKNYLVQVGKLRRFMHQNPRLASLSTYVLRGDTVHIILDTTQPNSPSDKGEHSFIMDVHPNPPEEVLKVLRDHAPLVASKPHRNKWGTFISGYAPIYNSSEEVIAAIGADISIEEIAASKSAIQSSAIIGLGLALLCSIGAGIGVYTLRRKALFASREASSAKEARKAAEFRYQHLFEQIPIGIINFNSELIVTDCNTRILQIGKTTRDNLVGMDLKRLQETRLMPCLKDALQNRESVYVGEYNITDGAENTWVEIHAGPIKDSSGTLTGGIATIEDITIRHRVEMMSEAEKNLLGMIARGDTLETVFLQLIDSIESLLPGSICSISMLDEEKKHFIKGYGPKLANEYLDALNGLEIGPDVGSCGTAAYTGKQVVSEDIQLDPRWNKYRSLAERFGLRSCWSMPIKSGQETIYGTFALYYEHPYKPGTFEQTLLENASYLAGIAIERNRFEQAISEERNLLRTLIDNIPDLIFIKDRFHKYLAANNAAFSRLKISSPTELIGKTDVDILPHDTALENHEAELRVLQGNDEINKESIATDSNGNVSFFSTSRMPLRNSSGEIIGLVTITRDVTDQKRIEEERIKTQKLESLGILAGGIAHDFNNILTSVLSNLSFVTIAAKNLSPENEEMLKEAELATHRAKELTQQLLTFAKGGLPVKKPSSIADLLKESATFALRGSACKLEFDLPDDLWMADIDGGQISQVIQNLLFNADQSMPHGGTITISGRNANIQKGNTQNLMPGRYIAVAITDQGSGIPDHVRDRIFDPYFTTKKAGNGLGLTTTFSIINKHSGHISAESTPEKGSTFTFTLPAVPEEKKVVRETRPAPTNKEPAHILIMDDEEAIRKISSRVLEHAGYTISLAEDGKQAIQIYEDSLKTDVPVDLTILDLTIPGGMGGKETFEKLKAIDPKVRALVSSGYSVDEAMARHEALGFVGVVTKPYSREELLSAIRTALSATPA